MRIFKRLMLIILISVLVLACFGVIFGSNLLRNFSVTSQSRDIKSEATILHDQMCRNGLTLSVVEQQDEQYKAGSVFVIPLIPIPLGEKETVKMKYLVLKSVANEILWTWNLRNSTDPYYLDRNISDAYFFKKNIAQEEVGLVAIVYTGLPEHMQNVAECIRDAKQSFEEIFERTFHSIVMFKDDEEVVFSQTESDGKRTEVSLSSFDSVSINSNIAEGDTYGEYDGAGVAIDANGIYQLDKPFVPLAKNADEEGKKRISNTAKNLHLYVNKNGIDFLTYYTNLKKLLMDKSRDYSG